MAQGTDESLRNRQLQLIMSEGNNIIKVYIKKWLDFHIPVGCYELEDIDKELQRQIYPRKRCARHLGNLYGKFI